MATHSSNLAWRIPRDGGAWRGYKELDMTEHKIARFREWCGLLWPLPRRDPVLLIIFLALLYFSTPVVKVFTLQKSANTGNQPLSFCRKLVVKHLPAHLSNGSEPTQTIVLSTLLLEVQAIEYKSIYLPLPPPLVKVTRSWSLLIYNQFPTPNPPCLKLFLDELI